MAQSDAEPAKVKCPRCNQPHLPTVTCKPMWKKNPARCKSSAAHRKRNRERNRRMAAEKRIRESEVQIMLSAWGVIAHESWQGHKTR